MKDGMPILIVPEQLESREAFEACVLSFFDGVLPSHRKLLSRGLAACGNDPNSLLVILCAENTQAASSAGTARVLLSQDERLQMLRSMGFNQLMIWPFPAHEKVGGELQWPVDPPLLAHKTKHIIPGPDLWAEKGFSALANATQWGDGKPKGGLDNHFRLKDQPDNTPALAFPGSAPSVTPALAFPGSSAPSVTPAQQVGRAEALDLLDSGQTQRLSEWLEYAYPLAGQVVEGNKIGRTLGYPTANLRLADRRKAIPGQGVYTALVKQGGRWYKSMVNIGIRPTLDLKNVTIEAHLFDFDKDIYGEWISIAFLSRIRDEMRFRSLPDLKNQLDSDREEALLQLQRVLPGIRSNDFVWKT